MPAPPAQPEAAEPCRPAPLAVIAADGLFIAARIHEIDGAKLGHHGMNGHTSGLGWFPLHKFVVLNLLVAAVATGSVGAFSYRWIGILHAVVLKENTAQDHAEGHAAAHPAALVLAIFAQQFHRLGLDPGMESFQFLSIPMHGHK